jgi:hypothetical protein
MATVILTPDVGDRAGVAVTRVTPLTTNTYKFLNDGKVVLNVRKTGANACTLTITTPGTVDDLDVEDRTVVVAATTGDVWITGLKPRYYSDAEGYVAFTVSEVTGLTIALVQT